MKKCSNYALLLLFCLGSSFVLPADEAAIESLQAVSHAFRNVAKTLTPSVVTIETVYQDAPQDQQVHPFFRYFGPQQNQPSRGAGSGIIYDKGGHIITNAHVIDGASEIEVVLSDGRRVKTELVGIDTKTDLAVIRFVNYSDFKSAAMGDSDKAQVGDWVIAIGNPLGFSHTVTHGIISAKGRSGLRDASEGAYEDFIQTDAAINQGNSGGALCNLKGEVIGINSMIASQSGGSQGLGFTIPINMARRIVDQLIENGVIRRGFLGVMIKDLDKVLAKQFDFDGFEGAFVDQVSEDSPADKAGIKSGDIIIELEGKKIKNSSMLRNRVSQFAPESKVKMLIYRDGKEKSIDAVLGSLEGGSGQVEVSNLGIKVRPLKEEELSEYPVEQGLVITGVDNNSPGMKSGLQKDMVISTVDRKPVSSVAEFRNLVRDSLQGEDDAVLLYVYTQKHGFYVVVEEE